MKKNILIFLLAFICSCHKDYRQIAKDYLKSKIINPESLQIDSITGPDSSFLSYSSTKEYKDIKFKCDSFMSESNKYSDLQIDAVYSGSKGAQSLYKFLCDKNYKESKRQMDILTNRIKNYKGELDGWDIHIYFRAKDSDRIEKSDHTYLFFNKDMSKIESNGQINL